jgi:murein DD-endopeptidase MepM/ murein hydrolase activator NlpD
MKKDRLIITISDVNSSKSFNISRLLKKIFLWAVLVTLIVVSLSFLVITKLIDEVGHLNNERDLLTQENYIYSKEIEDKKAKIDELGEKLDDIEDIIGINNEEESSLIQRATLAKLSSAQKMYMLQTIPSGCPLEECYVTSKFGWRTHPITKKRDYHKGTDLRAARRTPVLATADGVVRYARTENEGTFGRVVIILHNNGFETVYGHLRFTDVKIGDVVKKGQQIARSGNSGRSSGPHLHYEVRYATRLLDAEDFINWDMKNYEQIFEKQRRVEWESLVNLIKNQSQKLVQQ